MAHKVIQGQVGDAPKDFVRSNEPLGTETITSVCGASEIAIAIDTGVDLSDSQEIYVTLIDMVNRFMEEEFQET